MDKSAVGFDYQGKTEKHESQRGQSSPRGSRGCPFPSRRSFTHKHLGISPVVQIGLLSTYT